MAGRGRTRGRKVVQRRPVSGRTVRLAEAATLTQREWLHRFGIVRTGTARSGFHYRNMQGRAVDEASRVRIRAMVLPPAWREVAIHPSAHAKLQAVGKDAKGRWQYRYHASFTRRREREKYDRLLHFADALPKMRRTVEAHLRLRGLGREKVLACILRILSTCFIRPGSEVYAHENGSFGIATLRKRHVSVHGDTLELRFRGKSGQHQERRLTDRHVARVVRALLNAPRAEVFQYQDGAGAWLDVKRQDINRYIKEVMGNEFSAKDFRTWAGTLICACALARAGFAAEDSAAARKRKVVAAIKETAGQLGNTPAVCRRSYIYPSVLNNFERGAVVEQYFATVEELNTPRVRGSERALLKLLRASAA